jgi:dTDP-4-dehydrorhamnose reductase
VSTDYVFDGTKGEPYLPDDSIQPQSAYGLSKAEGDRLIRENLSDHVIVRTSWLYAAHGTNFVLTMLRLAGERSELRVVDDQVGCPTYARDLAAVLLRLGLGKWTGTYHFCNAGVSSWNVFAKEILKLAGSSVPVLPMSTRDLNRPARRPACSVLSTRELTIATGLRPRAWREALAECMGEVQRRTGGSQS